MKKSVLDIISKIDEIYVNPKCELEFHSNYELLVAVILSAQCTDKRVNTVTKELFKEFNTPEKMITLSQDELEEKIRACGFFRNKAKHILEASREIVEKFGGEVPSDKNQLKGLAGVGEKTALTLINKYQSLENIYENYSSSDLKPSVVKKLEAGKDSAFLSKTLATINCDVPDVSDIPEIINRGINRSDAFKLFSELEFSALIKKFELEKSDSEEKSETVERFVSTESKDELIKLLKDTNTAVIIDNGIIYAYNGATASHCSYDRECAEYLAENANELISYDIKSIYEASDKLGVRFRTIKDDVMLSAYVLDSQGGHDLERLVSKYLSGTIDTDESKALYVYKIAEVITAKISNTPEEKLYREIELPLAAVLADMEEAGFLIDREGIAAYGEKLKEGANALAERIYFLAGEEFNINSPKQLGDILFEKLKLPSGKKKR